MAGMQDLVGRRVKLTLDDGLIVSGFLHSYGSNDEKLSLEKVECIENGSRKKLIGLQHYFAEEITDIVVTEEVFKSKKKKLEAASREHQGGRSLIGAGRKVEPVHLSRLQNIHYPSLVLKSKKQNDMLTSSGNETGSSGSEQEVLPQSDEYTIISKLSTTFYEAITYINKYQVIALSAEGVVIGRAGKLCWLQIAVPDHIFLFDVLNMGRACFDEGVKAILENVDILKVFHDCRMISDMLHHQYDIRLVNVFDTQVANVFVYRLKHHQDLPRYVDGLSSCLVQHINLSVDDVNWSVVREKKREEDEMVWMERPPQYHLVDAAVKNVKHLLELRTILMEKMMEEFIAGVNIYLMHVRDANDADASRYQTSPHLLPYAFQDLNAFMSSYRGRNSFYHKSKDPNGFRDNSYGITQPNIHFSRDSVWHAGAKRKPVVSNGNIPASTSSGVSNGNIPASTCSGVSNSNIPASTSNVNAPAMTNLDRKATTSPNKPAAPLVDLDELCFDRQSDSDLSCFESPERRVATRKNLNSREEMEGINEMVAKMKSAKLLEDNQKSEFKSSTGVTFTENVDLDSQGRSRSTDVSDQEISGGRLMRSLVYEQDKTGFECNSGMDKFKIIPAGKMQNCNLRTKKSQHYSQEPHISHANHQTHITSPSSYHNHHSVNGYSAPPHSQGYDRLEQAIPGGDLVTREPPPPTRANLSSQEKLLLENINRQSRSQIQYDLADGTRHSESESPPNRLQQPRMHQSDTDSPPDRVPRPSGQLCNILQMQLQGKKSPSVNQSEPDIVPESPNTRGRRDHSHQRDRSHNIDNQQYQSPPAQHDAPSKLDILMQKLKK